ncbi:dehydratase [Seiridium cupressi]
MGVVNTYSSFNPCHANVPQLIEAVKRGAQLRGGLAIDFPAISIHESFSLPTRPMMPGSHRGVRIGACTDCRNNWASYRAGTLDIEDISAINDELAPTSGTCGVMGTAISSSRLRIAEETGRIAVEFATNKVLKPQALLTRSSFLNAITVLQAIGGSTNAVLVDLKPSGEKYMSDFHNSGGMLSPLYELKPLLHLDVATVTGRTLGEELANVTPMRIPRGLSCIQPFGDPLYPASSLVVLWGNLAPRGAVIKASASKYRRLLKYSGKAIIFKNSEYMARRLDDPDLPVTADSVLVLQNVGPKGNPGMPEAGLIPIPKELAAQGVMDMLRLSDGRMSGTAGGTVVLHISPESADPSSVLGIVQDVDLIICDTESRLIILDLSDDETMAR